MTLNYVWRPQKVCRMPRRSVRQHVRAEARSKQQTKGQVRENVYRLTRQLFSSVVHNDTKLSAETSQSQ